MSDLARYDSLLEGALARDVAELMQIYEWDGRIPENAAVVEGNSNKIECDSKK